MPLKALKLAKPSPQSERFRGLDSTDHLLSAVKVSGLAMGVVRGASPLLDRPKEKAGEGWEDMVDYVTNYEEGGPYVCSLGNLWGDRPAMTETEDSG